MADETQQLLVDAIPGGSQSDIPGLLAAALRRFSIDDDNCIPASVVAFDRDNNLVTVQPMIMWVGMDNALKSRHHIRDINCLSLGGGGFHISFPLKQGDLGWIIAGDRDIALFKASLQEEQPNTTRVHKFADGIFVPDTFRKYVINGEDSGAMVIQSTDGATRISIRSDNIKITAPSQVIVDTPKTMFTGDVEIQKNLTVDQNSTVTGHTQSNGGFTAATGTSCDLPATTTVNGKKVDGHTHSDPQGGNTGPF